MDGMIDQRFDQKAYISIHCSLDLHITHQLELDLTKECLIIIFGIEMLFLAMKSWDMAF